MNKKEVSWRAVTVQPDPTEQQTVKLCCLRPSWLRPSSVKVNSLAEPAGVRLHHAALFETFTAMTHAEEPILCRLESEVDSL